MIIDSPIISGSTAATGSLNQVGNVVITGSLTVTGPINGALTGSVDSASFSQTSISASYASNAELLDGLNSTVFTQTGSFNTFSSSILSYTGSTNTRLNALESTTGSLNTASGSAITRLNSLETTSGSLNTASGSAITRLNALEITTGSLNTASGSAITRLDNLETASGSAITRLNSLETTTGSLNTASGSAITRLGNLEDKTGSYATTGSNTFVSSQYISNTINPTGFTTTASLYTDGGLRVTKDAYVSGTLYLNNVTVYGTQSVNYITSSQLDISDNIINVNTATPNVRFGGLAVYDSGSTSLTGSMLWDSQNNNWIYSNPSGSGNYDSSMVIMGPRNASTLGNEQGLNCNYLVQGQGSHHTTSSMIFHDGSTTCFPGAIIGGTMSGTTIYASTAVCSPVGKFTSCIDAGSGIFSSSVKSTQYLIAPNGITTVYNIVDSDQTYAGAYSLQAGGGSGGYGGSLVMFGHSHATKPGYVVAGISAGSGGKFTVNNAGNGGGTELFTVDVNGVATFSSTITGTTIYGSTAVCSPIGLFSGCVGIGITSPTTKLDVYAGVCTSAILWGQTIRNEGNAATTEYGIGLKLKISGDGVPNELYKWAGITAVAGTNYSNRTDLAFYTNTASVVHATEKVRITGDGDIGIGTTIPYAKLHVAGTIYSNVRCNTIDTDDGISNNFQGYGGYWALRTDESNGFNLDVYGGGTPKTVLNIPQATGISCFSGIVCIPVAMIGSSCSPSAGINYLGREGYREKWLITQGRYRFCFGTADFYGSMFVEFYGTNYNQGTSEVRVGKAAIPLRYGQSRSIGQIYNLGGACIGGYLTNGIGLVWCNISDTVGDLIFTNAGSNQPDAVLATELHFLAAGYSLAGKFTRICYTTSLYDSTNPYV